MTDLAPLKLLAAGGSGGEATYQYPEEVYNAELYAGGQWYINPAGLVTANGTITTSNTNPYSTSYDRDGWYSSIFNGTGNLQLTQNTEFMNDVTGGPFFINFWMKTNVYTQDGGQNRTIFIQDTGYGSNYANKIKIDITTGQKIAVYKTIDLGGTAIITSTTSIGDDAWHYINVCRARGSTTVRLFVDGNADGTATESTSFGTVNHNANGPAIRLGAARDSTGRYSGSLHDVTWCFHNEGANVSNLNPTSNFTPNTTYPYSMYWVQNWKACNSAVNTKVKSWTNRKVIAPRINAFPAMLTWLKRQNTASTGDADAYGEIHQNITSEYGYDTLYPALANDHFSTGYSIRAYNDDDPFGGTPNRDYTNNKGANVGSFAKNAGEIGFSYIARTFKPAPGFCDILTYEGTGSAQTIRHNLNGHIGFMLIKDMDADVSWVAKHVSHSGADYYQLFDTQANQVNDSTLFNSTALTTSQFTVGTNALTNTSGHTYLVLMLAVGDGNSDVWGPSSNENMVKCDNYSGNGSTTGPVINVGFEPTTVIIKGQAISGNSGESYWYIFDTARKFESRIEGRAWLEYNKSWDKVESTAIQLRHNGFQLRSSASGFNESGGSYIYIAIRGPMRIPSAATGDKPSHFFNCAYGTADTSDVTGSFPGAENAPNFQPDFCMIRKPAASSYQYVATRKSGYYYRATNSYSGIDTSTSWMQFAVEPGFGTDWDSTYFSWMWKSAPGLTHVEYYLGTGSNQTINHNLGGTPEMMMSWRLGPQGTPTYTVYWHKGLNGGSSPEDYFVYAQYSLAQYGGYGLWQDTAPTSTQFFLSSDNKINKSGDEYSMVLFASLAGFQKVGHYTGNGSTQVIDCGFTTGSRYVMIKRTDSTGNWKQYDTERGLHFMASVNCNANDFTAEADDDFIRQDDSGFKLNTSDAEVNASGGNYIFLAVANDPT